MTADFRITRTIAAAPHVVWAILTNAETLSCGDFGIITLKGPIAAGARIKLTSSADPKRTFALRVTMPDPGRRMMWSGGMPFGLFTGQRTFTLVETGAGTQFMMEEQFMGPLRHLIGKSIPDLNPSFNAFADGLQHHAEGTSA